MAVPDLNLLIALDVLLQEGSVAAAARRLRLSPSATSRTLARLREVTGDPLLVRAGRGLAPTPRAEALRAQARQVVDEAKAILRPDEHFAPAALVRAFTLRTSDGFVETFGPLLLARISAEAPAVRLNFLQKPDKDSAPLREGRVDLETGIIEPSTSPELLSQALFQDRLVGVIRDGHSLSHAPITAELYGQASHVIVSRTGFDDDAVETPFLSDRLHRRAASAVGGFAAALALARNSDLIATTPERHTRTLREGMVTFELPVPGAPFTVSMLWHPRLDADPAHQWLRSHVRRVCGDHGGGA